MADELNLGTTLRDWFAGQALAGICAGLCASTDGAPRAKSRLVFREAAEDAYALADAMLAEREKTR